jgi:hypothetical protein
MLKLTVLLYARVFAGAISGSVLMDEKETREIKRNIRALTEVRMRSCLFSAVS